MTDLRAMAEDDVEEVDALPVVAEAPRPEPAPAAGRLVAARPVGQVVAQAAAVAVTSFAAGAVATAVVRKARNAGKPGPRRRVPRLDITDTQTFLVDVHTLSGR